MKNVLITPNLQYPHEKLYAEGLELLLQGKTLDAADKLYKAIYAGSLKADKLLRKKTVLPVKETDLPFTPTNPDGLYKLGLCYYYGFGIASSFHKAAKCFLDAAKKGHLDAQTCYARILSVNVEIYDFREEGHKLKEAIKWFHQAASAGNCEAQFHLGNLYHEGCIEFKSISKEARFEQAAFWFEKSARQNFVKSEYFLGLMYHLKQIKIGESDPDYDKMAYMWIKKAAEAGYYPAQLKLANILFNRLHQVPEEQKEEIFNEAFYWIKSSARGDFSLAQYKLGEMYIKNEMLCTDLAIGNHLELGGYYLRRSYFNGNKSALKLLEEQQYSISKEYNLAIIKNKHERMLFILLNTECWNIFQQFDEDNLHNDTQLLSLLERAADFGSTISGSIHIANIVHALYLIIFIRAKVNFSIANKINFISLTNECREQYIMHLFSIYLDAKDHEDLVLIAKKAQEYLIDIFCNFGKYFPDSLQSIIASVALGKLYDDKYITTALLKTLSAAEVATIVSATRQPNSGLSSEVKKTIENQLKEKKIIIEKSMAYQLSLPAWQQLAASSRAVIRQDAVTEESSHSTLKHKRPSAG